MVIITISSRQPNIAKKNYTLGVGCEYQKNHDNHSGFIFIIIVIIMRVKDKSERQTNNNNG